METARQAPLLTPLMRWFMLAMVLANIAGMMTPMLMPIYLTQLGASIGQVGLVFTLTSVVILALQILGGWISDSIGRLHAIAIGGVLGIFGFIALLLAPTWQWMLAALAIYQFPFALVGPSFGAFIAENSSEEHRGRVYGITGAIYQLTGVVGPGLGGLLMGAFGFKRVLLVAAVLYSLATVLRVWMATTMRAPQETPPARLSLASFKTSMSAMLGLMFGGGVITWILISDGVSDIAFRMSENLQPLYLEQIGLLTVQQIGLLGSIFSVAMMFTPMLSGKVSDQYGERVPLVAGFLLAFTALIIFLKSGTFPAFALSWVVFGTGIGLLGPAYQSLISKVVPARLLGAFNGVFGSSVGFISLPAPWLGAQLWERFSPRLPFLITALAALVILPPVWFKFKAPKSQPVALEPEPVQTGGGLPLS